MTLEELQQGLNETGMVEFLSGTCVIVGDPEDESNSDWAFWIITDTGGFHGFNSLEDTYNYLIETNLIS